MKHLALLVIISSLIFGQIENSIDDFYEYANAEWLEKITIPENSVVVNNWGILWDNIIDKSNEILYQDLNYHLDNEHQFVLSQLRKLYKSSAGHIESDRKRVEMIQAEFPTLFGIVFSEITFSVNEENRINDLIRYLKEANRIKIANTDKVGEKYKDLFIAKLDKMEFKVGAPSLSNFPKMPLMSSDDYENNIQLANDYSSEVEGNKDNWVVPPFETYCAYNFNDNIVRIHAGILYGDELELEDNYAYMYATIGRTIAHEMTHAYDNVGKNYDADGKHINKLFSGMLFEKNEWDNIYSDIIEQYDEYNIQDSLNVNGKKTLQENIADIGGVEISLLAFKLNLNDKKYSKNMIDNFLKYYFVEYASLWREKATLEFERSTLKRVHAPQKYRAIGPIYNQNEFYNSFEIDKNSKYFISAEKRIKVW